MPADQHSRQEREIERFEIQQDADEAAEVTPNGPWVRFEDHAAALQDREAEHARKEQIRESEVVEAQEHRALHEELRRKAEDRANQAEAALREAREELNRLQCEVACRGRGEIARSQPTISNGIASMHAHPTGDWVRYLDFDRIVAEWIAATDEADEARHREKQRAEAAEHQLIGVRVELERLDREAATAQTPMERVCASGQSRRLSALLDSSGGGG